MTTHLEEIYRKHPSRAYPTVIFTMAVMIPLAGIGLEGWFYGLEASTGVSGAYDPFFPTLGYRLLCIGCCLLVGWGLHGIRPSRAAESLTPRRLERLVMAAGLCLGVSAYYSAAMVPVAPLFLIMCAMGIGILGFSPYLHLIGALLLARRLGRLWTWLDLPRRRLHRTLASGAALGLLLIGLLDVPRVFKRSVMLAALEDPGSDQRAIERVGWFYTREEVLAACYTGSAVPISLWDSGLALRDASWNPTAYRQLYYLLTGQAFNAVPPPRLGRTRASGSWQDDWIVAGMASQEVGSDQVEGRVRALGLTGSRLEGELDPAGAWARLKWTMEFTNTSTTQREARMLLGLPPDAVASELSLWVNGKESFAAFGGREQARQAYRSVAVVQRRDPALLTTVGQDRLLLQVFPVPASGGARVAVEFTIPLFVEGERLFLRWPHIVQRNFEVGHTPHEIRLRQSGGSGHELRLSDPELARSTTGTLVVGRPGSVSGSSRCAVAGGVLQQTLRERRAGPASPGRLVLVIDGSEDLRNARLDWARLLGAWPAGLEITAILASPGRPRWTGRTGDPGHAAWLAERTFTGGIDPVPALEEALDLAGEGPAALVVWLHGDLPVRITDPSSLLLLQGKGRALVSLAITEGGNLLAQELSAAGLLLRAPRLGTVEEDLGRLIRSLGSAFAHGKSTPGRSLADGGALMASPFSSTLRVFELTDPGPDDGGSFPVSPPLETLHAWARVRMLLDRGRENDARPLAIARRLVTSVTGAVVLERREDYEANALEPPADRDAARAVPEPETVLLVLVGLLVLRRRDGPRPAPG